MILRYFARKLKIPQPAEGFTILEREMESYLREMEKKGIPQEEILRKIIPPENLQKISDCIENEKEIDYKSLNMFMPSELEKRLESKMKSIPVKSQDELIKKSFANIKSKMPTPKKS